MSRRRYRRRRGSGVTLNRRPPGGATKAETVNLIGRIGIGTSGVVHLIIGLLAIQMAFGTNDERADHFGAVDAVAHSSLGKVLIVLLAIGLIVLTVWYASKAFRGSRVGDGRPVGTATRLSLAAMAVFTAFVAIAAFKLALSANGTPVDTTSGGKEQQAIDRVLSWPAGQLIVIAIALGIAFWGYLMLRRALAYDFREQFRQLPKYRQRVIDPLGVAGFSALAVVSWIVAWFLLKAAIDYDADQVVGLDGALRQVLDEPYGPLLLLLIALGLAAFGIFRLFDASWRSRSFL
jgi:hypothetical protein